MSSDSTSGLARLVGRVQRSPAPHLVAVRGHLLILGQLDAASAAAGASDGWGQIHRSPSSSGTCPTRQAHHSPEADSRGCFELHGGGEAAHRCGGALHSQVSRGWEDVCILLCMQGIWGRPDSSQAAPVPMDVPFSLLLLLGVGAVSP